MRKKRGRKKFFLNRKSITGVKPRKKYLKKTSPFKKFKILGALILMTFLSCLIYTEIENRLLPIVMELASYKINTVATEIINQAVEETISQYEINTSELVAYNFNEKDELMSWGINTVQINQITSGIIGNITEKVNQYDSEQLEIPFGNIFGRSTFSDWGPMIKVDVLPQGTAGINYDREFVSTGINQINHRVWLNIEIKMKVIVPLDSNEVIVRQKVTLVDRVLHGTIPDSYVNVPEADILDVVE